MKKRDYSSAAVPYRSTTGHACNLLLFFCLLMFFTIPSFGQEKHLVQVKTFDQQLRPFKNAEISINGKDYIKMNDKGIAFIELLDSELPLKSVKIKNDQLEAASWNYSKGIVEIVIRKKSYQMMQMVLKNPDNTPVSNTRIVFHGKKTLTSITNGEGRFEIPLALDERMTQTQFQVDGFNVVALTQSENENVITIEPLLKADVAELPVVSKKPEKTVDYFSDFDLSKLDSIQSLTVFYAVFKNVSIKDLSASAKQRVDAKFSQLVKQLQDSLRRNDVAFIGKISDSSFVSDDIENLLAQASVESRTLEAQREDFDAKMQMINEKMAAGIENLDSETRSRLISDITRLEMILTQNENRFYRNQNDYRQIINSLKEKFFDLEDLENKLSESEAKRLEEQAQFRERLLITGSIIILFAILIVMLIWFGTKLRKQKVELERVNNEIKHINENLEGLVLERTRLLEEAHRELDTFLYRASHDLRSPVCSIIGLCNLATHFSNNETRDILDKVVFTTSAMDRLLKKLQIISEINQPSNFSTINLREMIEAVTYNCQNIIRKNSITFITNCPAHLEVSSYPTLIEAILSNLIENALFYTSLKDTNERKIELTAAIRDNHIHLTLHDNGIGIDNKIRDRIFDMFFKGHVFSKGNGLGLYIVQKSVQALDGNVAIESVPGQFTRFVVWIPLQPEVSAAPLLEMTAQKELA